MRVLIRLIGAALGVAVVAQSLVLWNATGRAAWTRYHDAARAAEDAAAREGSLADLFEDTGVHDDAGGAPEALANAFALGMLPSGPDRHAVSVLTLAGPGALMALWSLGGLAFGRRKACCAGAAPGAAQGSEAR